MNQHILKSGEYPSNLAVKYVGKESRWPELCNANPQLKKHATYGCVFPAVGTAINLPDSWPPKPGDIVNQTTTTTIQTPTSTTTVTSTVSPDLKESVASLLANVPSLTAQVSTSPASQAAAAAAVPASTTTNSTTAPAASLTVIPGAGTQVAPATTTKAGMWDGNMVKVGLIMASVLALGVVAYSHIKTGEGSADSKRTQVMKSNPRRRRAHPKGSRLGRKNKTAAARMRRIASLKKH